MDRSLTKKRSLKSLIPFGLGSRKPKHFRDMLRVAWENRDHPGYAWKVLKNGVCDGCALGVSGFHDWTIDGVHLCMTRLNLLRLNTMPAMDARQLKDVSQLVGMSNAQLRNLGRLSEPLLRRRGDNGFQRISWDDALDRIVSRIGNSSPERLAFFLTSRGITNEVYYVAQKTARLLGTNNIDNAARLCHSPSTGAMKHALGVSASTCSYRDWFGTDLIVFFGANPANDQPVTTKYLHEARKQGTRTVIVNPYLEPGMERYWVPSTFSSALFGTRITDHWYPVSQGGDIPFLYGVAKILIARGWFNKTFVTQHTAGFDSLKAQCERLNLDQLAKQCGLDKSDMESFASLLHDAKNAVFVWSMGITQHATGGDAVSMILNLGLLQGYVGRDKNGLMPIRGHSGVQGGAEMGAYATAFPGGRPIDSGNAEWLKKQYGFRVPDRPGLTATEMVEAGARGELDVLYCLGGNFLRTLPDPDYVGEAMRAIPMRVHQDIILTDQMLLEPKDEVILLPAKTRYEQEDGGTETTTERRVLFSPEMPREVGSARSEWKILRDLAMRAHPEMDQAYGCHNGREIREEIARVIPVYEGIQHLARTGDSFQYGGPHLCENGNFPTEDGRAHFRTIDTSPERLTKVNSGEDRFIVSTRRGKQFNTLVYAERDPLTGADRDAVLMNPEDAARLHLKHNDPVVLANESGRFEGRVFLAPICRNNLQIHWPEGNHLIRRGIADDLGGVPDYNAVVTIEKPFSTKAD